MRQSSNNMRLRITSSPFQYGEPKISLSGPAKMKNAETDEARNQITIYICLLVTDRYEDNIGYIT